MAFIISKKSSRHGKQHLLYYFVENYRKDNKIKRRTIFNLHLSNNLYDFYEILLKREKRILDALTLFEKKLSVIVEKRKLHPDYEPLKESEKKYKKLVEEWKSELYECKQTQIKVKSFM